VTEIWGGLRWPAPGLRQAVWFCRSGRTVALQSAYYLVCREAAARRPVVGAFLEWLPGRAVREKRV